MTTTRQAGSATDVLMQELKFSEEDVAANRAGHLSEYQQAYLAIDRRKNALLGAGVVTALVLGTATLLFVGIRDANLILQALGVVLMVCNAVAATLFGISYVRAGYDIVSNNVEVVEGEVQHVVRQLGRAQAGSVRIGDVVEIPTNTTAFKAFKPGQPYRLYRTAHTHRFLSVERAE